MPRIVRCSLIQATNVSPAQAMVDKHLGYIQQAADAGAQIICLQEIFNGPYFCAEQETRLYDVAEAVPDGPIVRLMMDEARKRRVALIVPVYEREQEGVYPTRPR
jgi:N-carbamoylputrescine amidase